MNEPSKPNPAQACDLQLAQRFLESDHFQLDEPELIAHLDSCSSCRDYLDACAATPEMWDKMAALFQPTDFDHPGTAEFAAATTDQLEQCPIAVRDVLELLTPSENPHHLGRLGIYEVTGVIGVGGMGVVLKAIDPPLERIVAVKVMAPQFATNERARKRFSREAKAAAAVIHPNVIPIHHVSNNEKIPYLVMSYHRGGSLQKRLDQNGPLPIEEVLRIGEQVAAGLVAAHERGIVHRDIKPENLLLEDGVERVAITDFGLARAIDDNTVTQLGTIAGTPMYMSPEQARGEALDQRSDLFSLGSVLYALCAGQPPYVANSSFGVMRRIIDEQPKPLRQIAPEIPDWLEKIINKLMAKDTAQRFQTAREVQLLLQACLAHIQSADRESPQRQQALERIMKSVSIASPATESRSSVSTLPKAQAVDAGTQGRFRNVSTASAGKWTRWAGIAAMVALLTTAAYMFIPGQRNDADDVYKQLRAMLKSGQPNAEAGRLVEQLMRAESGSQYLAFLDEEFGRIAHVHGELPQGVQAVTGLIHGREPDSPQLSFYTIKNGFSGSPTAGCPEHIQVHSIQFLETEERGKRVRLTYYADDVRQNPQHVPTIFDLMPETEYAIEIPLAELLDNQVDWAAVWGNGYPVSPGQWTSHDRQRIRGPWKMAKTQSAGAVKFSAEFFGSEFKIQGKAAGDEFEIRGSYALDPTAQPKSITMEIDGQSVQGTYDLEGDTLSIAILQSDDPRPASFDGDPLSTPEGMHLQRIVQIESEPSDADLFGLLCDKYSMPDKLHELISEAAGIPVKQLDAVLDRPTRNPNPDVIEGYPLTWLVFRLSPRLAEKNNKVLEDFRFKQGVPNLKQLAKTMSPSKSNGYYSAIQPSYIKSVVAKVRGDMLMGECQFDCDLYAGTIEYAVEIDEQLNLKLVEFTLPNYGIRISLNDQGQWERSDFRVEPRSASDEQRKNNDILVKVLLRTLDVYKLQYGDYPSNEQGLAALTTPGPNGQRPLLAPREGFSPINDVWGQPFNYRYSGNADDQPEVWSDGPDRSESNGK